MRDDAGRGQTGVRGGREKWRALEKVHTLSKRDPAWCRDGGRGQCLTPARWPWTVGRNKVHFELGGPSGDVRSDAAVWGSGGCGGQTCRFGRTRHLQVSPWVFTFFETLASP